MSYYFITDDFKNEIRARVVQKEFSNLKMDHSNLLTEYLIDIMDLIAIKFMFIKKNRSKYEHQFRQNDYQDSKGLLYMLLPFIDETRKSKTIIRSLDELYILKRVNSIKDINQGEPLYEFTNIQYGRCKRGSTSDKELTEIAFNIKHLEDNFILLKETIQIISNKLYINWIDVRPIPNDQNYFGRSTLFKNTDYAIIKKKIQTYIPKSKLSDESIKSRNYRGLYIGDIYNTLANYLFDDIIAVKWIIYDAIDNNYTIGKVQFYGILNQLLPLNNIFNDVQWNHQNIDEKISFSKDWNRIINSLYQKTDIGNIPNNLIIKVMKAITIFFDIKYFESNKMAKDGYKKLNIKELETDDEEVQLSRMHKYDTKIFASAQSIKPEMAYDYLLFAFGKFKNTWYGNNIFEKKDGKTKLIDGYSLRWSITTEKEVVTMKNIYNFSKSLTNHEVTKDGKKKFVRYPRYWRSLNKEDKDKIRKRLNQQIPVLSWFNIRGYLRYLGVVELDAQNIKIHNAIIRVLAKIIFLCLTFNGILSEFVPEKQLTDELTLPGDYLPKQKEIKSRLNSIVFKADKDKWKQSNYFVTNKPYNEHLTKYEKDKKEKEENYLKILSKGIGMGGWFTTYAMNWISQISFFHRYLNNNIIYVTGSTGVGKSSQVPKLLLYALKMVDYKTDGKIICSQPRRPPTETNARTISKQMGIPIEQYNKKLNAVLSTNNYNIQYQHRVNKHTLNTSGLILKIVTDGLLLTEIMKSPVLKTIRYDDRMNKYVYNESNKNTYDIVIVDEAHEHNKNMDFILTLMKYSLYYNNSIKLIIVSATMDDDEPTYRRFYRDINDNRMFPQNQLIIESDNKLDRINVDRRFHISPPGSTTRFRIDDIYKPFDDPDNLTLEIARKSMQGDILLFRPGKKQIKNSVEKLNKNLPPNFIALPYYGELSGEKRSIIENISDSSKKKLRYPRNVSFDKEIDESLIEWVPEGTYNRIVIVATNIAEASITINTLRYVVETGNQNIGEYDFRNRGLSIKLTKISESSRIQRRGRVGRVAPGAVYYIYKKGSMEGVKKPFDISVSDISENLFDLMYDKPDEKPLFSEINNPHKLNSLSKNDLVRLYPNGLHIMIQNQYFYENKFIGYRGKDDMYDYENSKSPHTFYESGYDKNTLEDIDGKFYIVHPDELYINRNINGKIVSLSDEAYGIELENYKIKSQKISSFWHMLMDRLFLYSYDNSYFKTQFGIKLMSIRARLIEVNTEDIITYLYSRKYNVENDILKLIAAYSDYVSSGMITNFIYYDVDSFKYKINEAIMRYGDCSSDSNGVLKILDHVLNFFYSLRIIKKEFGVKLITNENKNIMIDIKKKYFNGKKTGNYGNLDLSTINKLISLDHNNRLEYGDRLSRNEVDEFLKEDILVSFVESNLDRKREDIIKWCRDNYLNFKIIKKFVRHYAITINNFMKYDNGLFDVNEEFKSDDVTFKWFDNRLKIKVKYDKSKNITLAFLHGNGYKVAKKIEGSNLYTPILNPSPDNVYEIGKINRKTPIKNSLMKNGCFGNYILFLRQRLDRDQLLLVHNVTSDMVQSTVPFSYMPEKFLSENYSINRHKEAINHLSSKFIFMKNNQINDFELNGKLTYKIVNDYLSTIRLIKSDMLNSFTEDVYYLILDLDDNDKNIKNNRFRIAIDKNIKNQIDIKRNNITQYGGKYNCNISLKAVKYSNNIYPLYIAKKIFKY